MVWSESVSPLTQCEEGIKMKADKYLAMTDTFLRQSSKGEIPDKITRDLRFCMDEQEEKLRKNGISMREEYVFDDEAQSRARWRHPRRTTGRPSEA